MNNNAIIARALAACLFAPVTVCVGQGAFTPVSEMPGIVEPPVDNPPMNAPQVILGYASRYVVSRTVVAGAPHTRTALTQDFVTYEDVAWPASAVSDRLAGVSDDGTRIFSSLGFDLPGVNQRAAIWHGPSDCQVLSVSVDANQEAVGLSADGRSQLIRTGISLSQRGFLRNESGVVPVLIGDEPPLTVRVTYLSADGTAVGGLYNDHTGDGFWWTAEKGAQFSSPPEEGQPTVRLLSDNAARVVYNRPVGITVPGYPTDARGRRRHITFIPAVVGRDGSVVAGYTSSSNPIAMIWSETLGAVRLDDELIARAIDTRGWALRNVRYITADGKTMVGTGRAPGSSVSRWWVATMSAPFAAADIARAGAASGGDGRLDNNDLIVFIDGFFARDARADVGRAGAERGGDGLFDNNDFCVFIDLFFGGVP